MAMRKILTPILLSQAVLFGSFAASAAYDEAEVLQVSPVYETVRYSSPREECRQERVAVYDDYSYRRDRRRSHSAAPGLVGAIIGGAIGNGVGHNKTNKRVGLALGALLGGVIGNDIAKQKSRRRDSDYSDYKDNNETRYRTEEVCRVIEDWQSEQRVSGYDVTYGYAGETYTTRTDTHPGDTIRVNVRVTPVD